MQRDLGFFRFPNGAGYLLSRSGFILLQGEARAYRRVGHEIKKFTEKIKAQGTRSSVRETLESQ